MLRSLYICVTAFLSHPTVVVGLYHRNLYIIAAGFYLLLCSIKAQQQDQRDADRERWSR